MTDFYFDNACFCVDLALVSRTSAGLLEGSSPSFAEAIQQLERQIKNLVPDNAPRVVVKGPTAPSRYPLHYTVAVYLRSRTVVGTASRGQHADGSHAVYLWTANSPLVSLEAIRDQLYRCSWVDHAADYFD